MIQQPTRFPKSKQTMSDYLEAIERVYNMHKFDFFKQLNPTGDVEIGRNVGRLYKALVEWETIALECSQISTKIKDAKGEQLEALCNDLEEYEIIQMMLKPQLLEKFGTLGISNVNEVIADFIKSRTKRRFGILAKLQPAKYKRPANSKLRIYS